MHHPYPSPASAGFRHTLLALCLAGALSPVQADDTTLQTIVVHGQAESLNNALDLQQAADNIVSAVSADDIGQLPDTNAAEALQRVPGVTLERDQGEGRYVRVRGAGPDLNSVTINGTLVPAPESERRAVALDVIPAALIRSLEVSKTQTPDQDGNALGGSVEVKTLSAFDHPSRFARVDVEGSYDDNAGKTSPKLAAAVSDRFADGKLGVAAGISLEQREFGSDNVETGGAWKFKSQAQLEEFEQRRYDITRERLGGALNLDYRPDSKQSYYLRSLASRFSDEEERQAHAIEFDKAQTEGVLGKAESARELKSRKETQDILSLVLGTEQQLGDWKLDLALASSKASEDTPEHIAGAVFKSNDDFSKVGFGDTRKPELIGPDSMYDPAQFTLDEAEQVKQQTEDREHNLRFDLGRSVQLAGMPLELKFGAKLSRRKKTNDSDVWQYEGLNQAPSLAAASDGEVSYGLGRFGPRISRGAVQGFIDGLNRGDYYNEEESRVNDFTLHEDINAGYLQGTLNAGLWRILGGLRYEGTQFSASGTGVNNGTFVANEVNNDYHNWLPALHARRDLDASTALRAAWTKSVVRPTFGQLAPGFVIDGDEAQFGNPTLQPMRSDNLDLGIERRLGYAGVLSAYVFYKDIKNFAYQTDVAGSGQWAAFDEAITFANGEKGTLKGLELAWSQTFRQLPAPWNGLLAGVNASVVSSNARLESATGSGREIPLPNQSDRSANLMLGYEAGAFGARVALNYKSAYLLETGDINDASHDLYVDGQTQLDLSLRYALNKNTQLVFQALNLSDEKYYVYTGERAYNAQYESYGPSYKLGISWSLN